VNQSVTATVNRPRNSSKIGSAISLWVQERRGARRFSERAITVLEALVIALAIRSFLFQPFNIPSGSMEPRLLIGDYLFASKFSYGFSHAASRYCILQKNTGSSGNRVGDFGPFLNQF
jgi:signal peptidase I